MESKFMTIFLLGITFSVVSCIAMVNDSLSQKKPMKFQMEGKVQNIHAVKTIQSEDGDIIDCIDIYKQPALSHPSLRNHNIQLKPWNDENLDLNGTKKDDKMLVGRRNRGSSPMIVTTQIWHRNGSCPKGTIPIRSMEKMVNAPKYDKHNNYWRKKPKIWPYDKQFNQSKMLHLTQMNHSVAILHTEGYAYLGAKGDIKVWNPRVEKDDEYTTSRVTLKSGSHSDYEEVEAGWTVNPKIYGDRQTRLFVYWTADGSRRTGCFDHFCPGFVQTNHKIALGAAISPISNPNGLPYQITLYIHKDPRTSNWWVQYGERENLGYWPGNLFDTLRVHAETVQWGGEVYSPRVGTTPHTATGMGSGHFADWLTGDSGYVKRMRVLENSLILRFPEWVNSYSDEYNCYDTYYVSDYVYDPEFYYGGPGRNPMCP